MAFQVKLQPKAEKQLNNLPEPHYNRVLSALAGLTTDPWQGKKLKGKYDGSYSIRVWPYRIIYDIYKHTMVILIIKIHHRDHAYD